jgi:hypothetical protein
MLFSVSPPTALRESYSVPEARSGRDGTAASQPETSENVLFDPFVGRKEPPPKKRPIAPAALAAALLSFLPVASLAAIFVGVTGLRQTKLGTMRGRTLAIVSIVLGSLFTIGYTSAAIALGIHYVDEARAEERHEQAKWDRKQRERDDDEKKLQPALPEPTVQREPPKPIPAAGTVPQKTEEKMIGTVPVVDVGVSEPSLSQALAKQAAIAKAEGREVMVNVIGGSCEPCATQLKAFSDPLMQKAFAKTRVVRVSVDVFREDLGKLQMRELSKLPWYFLLRADGTPRDGINGGEWGEDVATNMAPVLGPFARGELKTRKEVFKPAAPNGTFL